MIYSTFENSNYFEFKGTPSLEFNCVLLSVDAEVPIRDVERIEVPGLNGTLTISNNRFNDVKVVYRCAIVNGDDYCLDKLKELLVSSIGYCRLEDTYTHDVFRLASFESMHSTKLNEETYEVKIEFVARPEIYLKTGEDQIEMDTNSLELINPTSFTSKPLFEVYGNGELAVNSNRIKVKNNDNKSIFIDCETMLVYGSNKTNRFKDVEFLKDEFPVFEEGINHVSKSNGMNVRIVGRWWHV